MNVKIVSLIAYAEEEHAFVPCYLDVARVVAVVGHTEDNGKCWVHLEDGLSIMVNSPAQKTAANIWGKE